MRFDDRPLDRAVSVAVAVTSRGADARRAEPQQNVAAGSGRRKRCRVMVLGIPIKECDASVAWGTKDRDGPAPRRG